jgi:hypothetical protein
VALALAIAFQGGFPARVWGEGETALLQPVDESKVRKSEASLYVDIFDQVFYEEGVQFLRLGDLWRKIARSKSAAWNVNVYDEVPDSLFFINRHGRKALSRDELQAGPLGPAPAPNGWTVIRGKVEGVSPGFFIKDETGQEFLLKFDPIDNPEMASAAESISARIFHAIGYNVPAYNIVSFHPGDMEVNPDARYYDDTGFKKPLTKERVEEMLLFVAREADESCRASASTLLGGKILGPFHLDGRRRSDPNDTISHRYRREIRALRVFASWANYYDLRTANTLDVIEEVGGQKVVKHYVIDFGTTLGSAETEAQPPQFGHEHVFDWGVFYKALGSFGFWKKPWQKRWDENERKIAIDSVGYFDNKHFDPGDWKTQVPYHAFKDLTAADGYWAAKIVMSFRDEHIDALVDSGKLSDREAIDSLKTILKERRDMIGRYWFSKSAPLDGFEIAQGPTGPVVRFTDLMKHYGLDGSPARYRYRIHRSSLRGETEATEVVLDEAALPDRFVMSLQAKRGEGKWGKKVCLTFEKKAGGLRLSAIEREL